MPNKEKLEAVGNERTTIFGKLPFFYDQQIKMLRKQLVEKDIFKRSWIMQVWSLIWSIGNFKLFFKVNVFSPQKLHLRWRWVNHKPASLVAQVVGRGRREALTSFPCSSALTLVSGLQTQPQPSHLNDMWINKNTALWLSVLKTCWMLVHFQSPAIWPIWN